MTDGVTWGGSQHEAYRRCHLASGPCCLGGIRLRIFYDPKTKKGYSSKGYCDLPHTLRVAKRAKAAGMGFRRAGYRESLASVDRFDTVS